MKKRNSWFWNVIIVLTVIVCAFGFGLHYKNWTSLEEGQLKITSGIFRQQIPIETIAEIEFVPKLPKLQRKKGFSWLAKEKGVFIDSLSSRRVHVFVDDLRQPKIRMLHSDSLELYFNLSDSLETQMFYNKLNALSSVSGE